MRFPHRLVTEAFTVHAARLLKQNIDALLKARHQTQHDLAQWCRRSDAWLSKVLSEKPSDQARGLPLKYLDRIADFFGLATYQLFQPGITPLLERRKGERRSGRDRRLSALNQRVRESVSQTVANLTQEDVADLLRIKSLNVESRAVLRKTAVELERSAQRTGGSAPRLRRADRGQADSTGDVAQNAHRQRRVGETSE